MTGENPKKKKKNSIITILKSNTMISMLTITCTFILDSIYI